MTNKIPEVALIGRQNVGKSTLFNRLIGYKKAIIDSVPGVTRDIVSEEISINGITVKLSDSGGLSDDNDFTNKLVQQKTNEISDNADLILFVVDINEINPLEKEYINKLKRKNKNIILVCNKADVFEKEIFLNQFYSYGVKEIIAISANHNRNIDSLRNAISGRLKDFVKVKNHCDEDFIKIAIIGKPNVGKSSLLNKILNKERSIVSSIPGTTRDIVDDKFIYKDKRFIIIDTAGIRKKSKVKEDIEYYSVNRAIKSISNSDIVFFVIDSTIGSSDQDKKIVDQVVNSNKSMIVLLNKWDLQDRNDSKKLKEIKEFVLFKFPQLKFAPIMPVSAVTGYGLKAVLNMAIDLYNESFKRIETSIFNDFVQNILKSYSPSSKKGVLKVYYATQTAVNPPEFVFFVNKKDLIPENYSNYIINKIREHFGFKGIPIKLIFKEK